jgi:polyhydroxyalkanoate synthesis regulator phasin
VIFQPVGDIALSVTDRKNSMDSKNWITQLLMIGVGTTSLLAEKLKEVSDEWVRTGKLNPEQAKEFVDDLMRQMRTEQGNFDVQMQRHLRNVLQDLGVPRQAEMDELRGRLDRLERQVRDLENKLWR